MFRFKIPPGKATGCLPRASKVGDVCDLFADKIKIIPQSRWKSLIGKVDLRPYVNQILDQNGNGSCFEAGTLIRMEDGNEKPIEKVQVLDRVLTAEGNVRTVMQTMVREHAGELTRLLLNGSHHVRCTPEHPILTERGYVPAGDLVKGDFVAFPRYIPESVKFIQTLDHVWSRRHTGARRTMRSKTGTVSYKTIPGRPEASWCTHKLPDAIYLTLGFGRIVGLFLAEGCTSYGKVIYTFAKHEKDTLASELIDLFRTELGVEASLQIRGNSTVKVNVHGVQWAKLFESLCSKLSGGKRVHADVAAGPREFLEGVLSGWTDGDGIGPNRFGGSSVSHSLAMSMFDIANGLGLKPTIRQKQPKLSHGVKSRQRVSTVEWGQGELRQKTDYRKHQTDTHLWRRVEGVEYEPFSGHVFNLEIDGDHSYVAEGIGVHNCATESTTQGGMICREFGNQPFELLNPLFIYHHTSGGSDRGSNIDSNLVFARDKGIAPESVWPRSKGFRAKPTAAAYEAALKYRIDEFFDITSIEEVGTALLSGMAVVFGWSGHSCIMTSLKSETTAEYANSWGNWGDKGFGTIRLASINFGYGAFAIRSVTDSGETET